jgi:hypothetical protein
MQSFSVFGDALNPGDPFRRRMDPTGYMTKLLQSMPLPNAYDGASALGGVSVDGLNTAVHRWVRRTVAGPAGGTGQNIDAYNRQQLNIKIDHHFNANHRLSGTWVRESHYTDNNNVSPWPTGFGGEIEENPRVRTLQLTSTLSPAVLNEFRYGYRVTTLRWHPAIETPKNAEAARAFLQQINGFPVYIRPALFTNHVLGASGDLGNTSPLATYTDTLNWTKGSHGLKFGVEFRYAHTSGWSASGASTLIPAVNGGAGDVPVRGIDTIPGLLPNNITLANNLLLSLSGSVQSISQKFETREPTDTRFLDYRETYSPEGQPKGTHGRIRRNDQNEFNFFIKDDWKVTPNFTLNMGVRYDLFRVPTFKSVSGKNWTRGLLGGNAAVFGYSGRSFAEAGSTPEGGGITGDYRDLLNRNADYTVQASHRTHDVRAFGTFELPFGPGRWLGGGANGILARLIEGWQFGTILNMSSGAPLNIPARNTISANGSPDITGVFPRQGQVAWSGVFGNYFGQQYQRVPDPACARVASNLRVWCTNTAIADASGNIVLQNARPGQLCSLGLRPIYGPGSWGLDTNIQKRIRIAESKNLTLRVDARNLFNHPTPANPNLDINAGTFGEIATKTGNRTIAAQMRLEF